MYAQESDEPRLSALIIEDDRTIMLLATKHLSDYEGVHITKHVADNAQKGIALFSEHQPDVTFLDINLPDGNGLELLETMRFQDPEAFIVMMTGSAHSDDVYAAKAAGVQAYILKPFDAKRFHDVIRLCLMQKEDNIDTL